MKIISNHLKLYLTFFVLVSFFNANAQQFIIQPGTLEFKVNAGTTETKTIRILNTSAKPVMFEASLADWLRDSTGGHQYFRPDTLKRSCASWVSIDRNVIQVMPQQTAEMQVTLRVPSTNESTAEMKWAMLFLQTVSEKDAEAAKAGQLGATIKELLRVGIHIYQTPPNIITKQAVANYLIKPDTIPDQLYFGVANTGKTMLQCKAFLTLTNLADGKETKLDRIEFPMFPDGKRRIIFKRPADLPKGKYACLAVLNIGDEEELQAIEKTIDW